MFSIHKTNCLLKDLNNVDITIAHITLKYSISYRLLTKFRILNKDKIDQNICPTPVLNYQPTRIKIAQEYFVEEDPPQLIEAVLKTNVEGMDKNVDLKTPLPVVQILKQIKEGVYDPQEESSKPKQKPKRVYKPKNKGPPTKPSTQDYLDMIKNISNEVKVDFNDLSKSIF